MVRGPTLRLTGCGPYPSLLGLCHGPLWLDRRGLTLWPLVRRRRQPTLLERCDRADRAWGHGAGRDGARRRPVVPVVPAARIAIMMDQRIVERSAVEVQILGFGLAHGVEQLEAGDIGVAARGNQ